MNSTADHILIITNNSQNTKEKPSFAQTNKPSNRNNIQIMFRCSFKTGLLKKLIWLKGFITLSLIGFVVSSKLGMLSNSQKVMKETFLAISSKNLQSRQITRSCQHWIIALYSWGEKQVRYTIIVLYLITFICAMHCCCGSCCI